jgi:hypothetical protein
VSFPLCTDCHSQPMTIFDATLCGLLLTPTVSEARPRRDHRRDAGNQRQGYVLPRLRMHLLQIG